MTAGLLERKRYDEQADNQKTPLAAQKTSGITSIKDEPEPPLNHALTRPKGAGGEQHRRS